MKFIFTCPHCHNRSHAQTDWIGLRTRCPHCQAVVVIQRQTQTSCSDQITKSKSDKVSVTQRIKTKSPESSACPSETELIFTCPKCFNHSIFMSKWDGLKTQCAYCNKWVIVGEKSPSFLRRLTTKKANYIRLSKLFHYGDGYILGYRSPHDAEADLNRINSYYEPVRAFNGTLHFDVIYLASGGSYQYLIVVTTSDPDYPNNPLMKQLFSYANPEMLAKEYEKMSPGRLRGFIRDEKATLLRRMYF